MLIVKEVFCYQKKKKSMSSVGSVLAYIITGMVKPEKHLLSFEIEV